jgi:hypothetical protein
MATFAARRLQPMIDNVAHILGIEWLAAAQGIEFLRPLASSPPLEAAHRLLRQACPAMAEDRFEHAMGDADALMWNIERDPRVTARDAGEIAQAVLSQRDALAAEAALRVLRDHPIWSDRRVAELCALSPKTVARLRPDAVCPSADRRHLDVREGRDRRLRPVRPGSARARVVEALQDQPDASLRTIAAAAGVSPETVRLVRLNLAQGDPAVAADEPEPAVEPETAAWRTDAALASSEQGKQFLAWFERTAVATPDLDWIDAVPLGRIYVVADEARRRSETWLELARALEARAGRGR